ncbi:hypothetical protein V8C35DRAFT_313522 [Trichoderma chlorosporum]
MKLVLDIGAADKVTLGPEDEIRGTMNILGHAGQVLSHLRTTFGGRLIISIPAQIAGPNPNHLDFTLFEETKELEYNKATSNKDDPGNGIYIVPFSFRFPSQVSCIKHAHALHLPPSMDIREAQSRIRVEYYLIGAVDRQIIGPISKTTRAVKGLKFSNNVPINSSRVLLPNTSLPLVLRQKDGSRYLEDGIDGLPAYAPSLRVEALLPEPPVFIRGEEDPIKFLLHIPEEMVGKIFVRTATINFRTSTVTTVASVVRRVDEHYSGASLSGNILVKSEQLAFDSGAWGRRFKLNLKPTFESCVMQIKNSVEIKVGISLGPQSSIYYTSSCLDILVTDPPPAYENAD